MTGHSGKAVRKHITLTTENRIDRVREPQEKLVVVSHAEAGLGVQLPPRPPVKMILRQVRDLGFALS